MKKQESIAREFEEFKQEILLRTKEELFDNASEINFYKELYKFILNLDENEEVLNGDFTLKFLYDFYLKNNQLSINGKDHMKELLISYNQRFRVSLNKMMAEYYLELDK
jgi:hypothetical protein